MTQRETYRLAPPLVFWWGWLVFIAANVADYAAQGVPAARFVAVVGAILLFVTGLAFALALYPRVIADGDGITVVNPFRAHFVPWRLVTFVDTGEWVRVHYALEAGEAAGQTVHCWALYVSAGARRKIAAGPSRPRDQRGLFGVAAGLGRGLGPGGYGHGWGAGDRDEPGGGPAPRLPEEARYLASLPPAKAMAVRLDSRADRERARAGTAGNPPRPTVRWSRPALAAVVIPALILLAVAVA